MLLIIMPEDTTRSAKRLLIWYWIEYENYLINVLDFKDF